MQNPSAVWGNLGGQINSALQTQTIGANIDLMRAQANKLNTEAGTEIPAQVDYLKSMTGLNDTNAKQAMANIDLIQSKVIGQDRANDYQGMKNDEMQNITLPMGNQNREVLEATRDAIIGATNSDATAKQLGLEKLRNLSDIQKTDLGKFLNWLNAVLEPISTGAQIGAKFRQ